jgi:SAM-dependent methyltransferase
MTSVATAKRPDLLADALRLTAFSARTGAWRGFRDWNVCYERVFEYGTCLQLARDAQPCRVLDVAGDISLFGCLLAEHLKVEVDIVDMSDLHYCAALRARLDPCTQGRIRLIPRTRAEDLPGDRRYDLITCISALEHFEGDSDLVFMESVGDLLEPDGFLFLSAPFTTRPETESKYRDNTYYIAHGEDQVDRGFYMRYYSPSAIADLVACSGLELHSLSFAGEVVNFCDRVFLYGPEDGRSPLQNGLRRAVSYGVGLLSPLWPLLFMRSADEPWPFTIGPRRRRITNPDTFLLALQKPR